MEDELIVDHEEESQSEEGADSVHKHRRSMTPVDYVVRNDPNRKAVLRKIRELEEGGADDTDASPEEVESILEKTCALYDMLENEGMATGRATNILKELGG